jgi:hypothetical protein
MIKAQQTDVTGIKANTVMKLLKRAANRRAFALMRYTEAQSRLAAANEQYAEVEELAVTMGKKSETLKI